MLVLFASSLSQRAAPDFNGHVVIAVGSAGPQAGPPDRSGQRRTPFGTWAARDFNRHARKNVKREKVPERGPEDMPDGLPEDRPDRRDRVPEGVP